MDGAPTSDVEVIRMSTYLTCAEEFGWTPSQTDQVEGYLLEEMLVAVARKKERERQNNG